MTVVSRTITNWAVPRIRIVARLRTSGLAIQVHARREDADLDVGGEPARLARKDLRRLRQRLRLDPPQADRIDRAPVDRHRVARAEERQRLRRLEWVEVSLAELRAPSPDRDQRQVEAPSEFAHAGE